MVAMASPPLDANSLAIRYFFTKDEDAKNNIRYALDKAVGDLARSYARKCRGNVDHDDLYQAGMHGAFKALKKFTPDEGDYEPYAIRYVRGEMLHLIRDLSLLIKIPGSVKEAGWKIAQFTAKFREEHDCEPSVEDVSKALNLSRDRAEHCMSINRRQKTTETLEDWHSAPAKITGQAADQDDRNSLAMRIYKHAMRLRLNGYEAEEIGDMLGIDYEKAETLLRHIDSKIIEGGLSVETHQEAA